MNYLLDTHTLIWAITDPKKLSKSLQEILQNTDNEVYVSVISFWEISLKYSIGKLYLEDLSPDDFLNASIQTGFKILPLEAKITSNYYKLTASYHKDPFDRMLIWEAIQRKFVLMSKDGNVRKYVSEGLKVIF